jgi:CarD family transcriptional regulator
VRGAPPRHPDDPKAELSSLEGTIADAAALEPGDRLVYPAQGVCVVVGLEAQEIAGQRLQLIRMRREEDGATVLVPHGKVASVGLRRIASAELMEGVFHYLAAQIDDPELNWKIRHRDNADRMVGGGVLGIAEVVKGLHTLSRLRPLPTKEREQYDNARHLLVSEVAASLGVPAALAEDYVDHALMPPAGTVFKLKPPPKPILMPNRPPRRRVVIEDDETGLEGLGLDDLGIDGLVEEATAEGAGDGAVAAVEGGEEAEGEEATEAVAAPPVSAASAGASAAKQKAPKVTPPPPAKGKSSVKPARPSPPAKGAKPTKPSKPSKPSKPAAARKPAKPGKPVAKATRAPAKRAAKPAPPKSKGKKK